jgi:hypothetical protein
MPDVTSAAPRGRVLADSADPQWMAFLRETCGLLWPPPAVVTLHTTDGPSLRRPPRPDAGDGTYREFALIPGLHRPPVLVPAGRRAAAAAVRYHSGARSPAVRFAARTLATGLAAGLSGAVRRGRVQVSAPRGADTIETYLGSVLSTDIRVSMKLGRPRANRKPVLQLLDDADRLAGFVKIGVNPLTRGLVQAEHDSLRLLASTGLTGISIPRVLHYGTWRDLNVLVLSPLPAWHGHRPVTAAPLAAAMGELAAATGQRRQQLAGCDYLPLLGSRLAEADESPERAAVRQALGGLAAQAGDTALTFGCWHGDWAPWNMANTSHGLLVWDWERFATGVPLGFDALHYWLNTDALKIEPRVAASRCLDRAAERLAPFRIPPDQARLTATLYLADLATRYIVDRQAEAGAALGATGSWLIPVIAGEVARLRDSQPGRPAGS